ncbi:MAG: HlyD family efflux transporter periplasmic adaptor subunit [Gemmatimonadetes bacterium]|nr:efflux RND transporter periplasmic adaptor subunit [Gemmatimonadota bacterium]NNM04186.1 HlyD family efflux transporter periplasmic adaptor subunit [Gemmatimonadota bacterium]
MKPNEHTKGRFHLALLFGAYTLVACGGGGPDDGATDAEAGAPEPTDELHLESQQIQDWGVTVGAVGQTTISAEFTLPGALSLNENRTAFITPLVEGQISGIRVDLGSRVGPGQVLATMNSPEFTRAQTDFIQAYAQAELSRKDFERAQTLRDSRAIEEREFLRRQAVYEQHLAARRAAEVVLHSLGLGEDRMRELEKAVDVSVPPLDHAAVDSPLPIRTPIGGVVIERHAVLGEHAQAGHPLFTVSDLSSLWARLDAYEDQMAFLDRDAEIVIRTPIFPDRDFPGRVTFIADQVDEQLRTVRVRAEVPNPDGVLRPNMYVQGILRILSDSERMAVPPDAVQLLEGRHVVFVLMPEAPGESHIVIRAVDVEPGVTLSVGRIIESGLNGTETIVTVGAFNLKAELTKGAGGHGHVH